MDEGVDEDEVTVTVRPRVNKLLAVISSSFLHYSTSIYTTHSKVSVALSQKQMTFCSDHKLLLRRCIFECRWVPSIIPVAVG